MRTYAIGDVHGMDALLERAIAKIGEYAGEATVVFLGDYVDRGPESFQVIDRIKNERGKRANHTWVPIMGNHDQMFADQSEWGHWLPHYGLHTLQSYGGYPNCVEDPDLKAQLQEHIVWARELPTLHVEKTRVFVHAGLVPGKPPIESRSTSRLWIREEFLNSDYDWGKLVIHGHTPTFYDGQKTFNGKMQPFVLKNRVNLDTGACWPRAGGCLTLMWWDGPEREPTGHEQFS